MAKPNVFIGSSVEQKQVAELVQTLLDYDVNPIPWTQDTFEPTQYPLIALEGRLKQSDFAVLVCAPEADDHTVIRGKKLKAVRDNIIFELGLAIGRLGRERTFLIAPRGVDLHLPSDLAGIYPETYDASLLPTSPEAALGPACSRIKRTMAKLGVLSRVEIAEATGEEATAEAEPSTADELENSPPTTDWGADDFRWNYLFATISKNNALAAHVSEQFFQSKFATSVEDVALWESSKQYAEVAYGTSRDISTIRANSEKFPKNAALKEILARALLRYGPSEEAGSLLLEALSHAKEMALASVIVTRAVKIDSAGDPLERARSLLHGLNAVPRSGHEAELAYLRALESIAQYAGFREIAKSILEVAVAKQPEDTNARFRLAYEYTEANQNQLSMLHYDAIPQSERSGVAWNNLGVAYSRLLMKGMSVAAYQEGSAKGETLSDGNLAHVMIGAGFFAEAKQQAEVAIAKEDHDQSVVTALSALQAAKAEEASSLSNAMKIGQACQKLRKAIGNSAISFEGPDLAGDWLTSDGPLRLVDSRNGSYLGTIELAKDVVRRGLLGDTTVKETVKITVSLNRFGSALEGVIKREGGDSPNSLLASIGSERRVLLSISQDGQALRGFQLDLDETPISWERIRLPKELEPPK
ncbi:TIR domain-containing protein [Rhizobium leguminosarum]|uniref:TIR domain-containing protein n=1 Tax=Rhizobium leguminosarum TaxID=384 RepID=UPI003F94B367